MEGDKLLRTYNDDYTISIHSLRMEGDVRNDLDRVEWKYFNPLPPHGGRR